MNSREKFKNALNHQNGPVPVDLGATAVTGMHCDTVAKVRELLGLERKPVKVIEPYQMLGQIDDDLKEALGVDTVALCDERAIVGIRITDRFKEWTTPWGLDVLVPEDFNVTRGPNGDIYLHPEGDVSAPPSLHMPTSGRFFDSMDRQQPYDEENLDLEENSAEFSVVDDTTLASLERDAKIAGLSGRGIIGSFGGAGFGDIAQRPQPGAKNPKGIRGVADWYMLLASNPDFVKRIFDVQLEASLESLKRIAKVVGDANDVVYICGTDFGTQIGTFCSVDTFRNIYRPYYVAVNKWVHENTSWKTFKHSCGAVESFIPEFIDAGFDVLNPVQWVAKGMEREKLKAKYGKDIVFYGGGIDTQRTLPFGTADEVYNEALECCRIFGEGGGYVFNAVHNIQAKVPAENVVAMFKAVADYNEKG